MDEHGWRRHLPHIERAEVAQFLTFRTDGSRVLPPTARDVVLKRIVALNGTEYILLCAVVMPDHVHMILEPHVSLSAVVRHIKGPTAREINLRLRRNGRLWQDEYFDRVLRSADNIDEKVAYLRNNPVRAGLVSSPEEYRWLWCSTTEMWCGDQAMLDYPVT